MTNEIEEDYLKPTGELYDALPEETRVWVKSTASTIRTYFYLWCIFIVLSGAAIYILLLINPLLEEANTWFQRSGSLITLVASIGEATFIVKLNKLVSVRHWANLTCEIYIERVYKPYLHFSIVMTFLFIVYGTITWGYGDLLHPFLVTDK
jgi:hypothetical protein